ncbi:MAG TPA: zinc-ribbon domain-containing protein, partial [Myxococcales bacterium]|nr:zinc-ribbon domain-containing protein [Myxococcales bacterium]
MKVSCPSCGTNYNIDDKRIPPGGAKLKCAKCQSTFPIKRDGAPGGAGAAAPLPGAGPVRSNPSIAMPGAAKPSPVGYEMNVATSPAIPLPGPGGGSSGPRPSISATVPRPTGSRASSSATVTAAVPLPGGVAANPFEDEATHAALPLPGSGEAPPPDAASGPSPWSGESTRVASIPMPAAALRPSGRYPTASAAPPAVAAIPLPGSGSAGLGSSASKPLGAVPLPGSSSGLTTSPGMPFARSSPSP